MNTIYLDFDNTIVESNKRVIDILNNRYNLSKTESDLNDYHFNSIYPITEKEKLAIEAIPEDLNAAMEELKKDTFIREVLGEHIVTKYVEAKHEEWVHYRAQVTKWEIDEYLYKI